MSISSTTRKAGPFAGNNIQTVFAFAFKVFATSDVVVTRAVASVETVLTLGVDYSVALNADQDAAPGGTVTLNAALAVGATLVLTSNVTALQQVIVTNAGGFFPAVFNLVFDKLTILIQQLAERLSRTLAIQVTASGVTSFDVPVLPSGVLQWKSDGTGLQAITLPDLSLSLALPNDAGHGGEFLTTNGAGTKSWSAVTGFVPTARTVSGGGLVTGGGALNANQTLTVTAAAASDVRTGTDSTKALVASALMGSAARQTLTDAATIAWNMASGYNATVTPSVAGRTIGAPTNPFDGQPATLEIVQPAGGGVTVVWNAIFNFKSLGTPVLSTAATKRDLVGFMYNSATSKWDCTGFVKDA